jgi:hypothetical protein
LFVCSFDGYRATPSNRSSTCGWLRNAAALSV